MLTSPQRDPVLALLLLVCSHVRPVLVLVLLVRTNCLIFRNSCRTLCNSSTSILPVPTDSLLDCVVVLSCPLVHPLLQCPPTFLTWLFSPGGHRVHLLLASTLALSPHPFSLSSNTLPRLLHPHASFAADMGASERRTSTASAAKWNSMVSSIITLLLVSTNASSDQG
jgi:hypothetical protein